MDKSKLDGYSVETTAVGSGTYFDHDANGFAESTGWAGADDGLLVRDINNNGRIDSGRELFGTETLLTSANICRPRRTRQDHQWRQCRRQT